MGTKRIVLLFAIAATLCLISWMPDKDKYDPAAEWTVKSKPSDASGIPWARFYWISAKLGKKRFDKSAMMIPVRMQGHPYYFNFQFDLGADVTMIYANSAASVQKTHQEIALNSPTLLFGDFAATFGSGVFQMENLGEEVRRFDTTSGKEATILGTIGADMFKDKVLIIDYPKERFSILDAVPAAYASTMTSFTVDNHGRILLPMQLNGQKFRIMFDNGSSIFQLITSTKNIDKFSKAAPTHTMKVPSWGKKISMHGRPIKDNFTLGGQPFSDIVVYESPSEMFGGDEYDAITGNALFLDKVVIFDLKNKQVGFITPKP